MAVSERLRRRQPQCRLEVREGWRKDLLAKMGRAAEAPSLNLVPAVGARVLPARHAEVEGLVERVQLVAGDLALFVVTGVGERLFQRRLVTQDVVLEALRERTELAEAALLGNLCLERVASATTLAE